jgi:hypothetical protein
MHAPEPLRCLLQQPPQPRDAGIDQRLGHAATLARSSAEAMERRGPAPARRAPRSSTEIAQREVPVFDVPPDWVEPVLVDEEPLGEVDWVPLDWPVLDGELLDDEPLDWLPEDMPPLVPVSLELPMLPLCEPELDFCEPVLAEPLLLLLQPARVRAAAPHTAMAMVVKRFMRLLSGRVGRRRGGGAAGIGPAPSTTRGFPMNAPRGLLVNRA